jgi:hypothetical protein
MKLASLHNENGAPKSAALQASADDGDGHVKA